MNLGPKPETIRLLGDKISARKMAQELGIPVIPGVNHPITALHDAEEFLRQHGFPVMIKAVFGGGGKGIRVVTKREEFAEAFERCVSESQRSFGDGSVFLEKFLDNPRHIEIQIVGDATGDVIHLYERVEF